MGSERYLVAVEGSSESRNSLTAVDEIGRAEDMAANYIRSGAIEATVYLLVPIAVYSPEPRQASRQSLISDDDLRDATNLVR